MYIAQDPVQADVAASLLAHFEAHPDTHWFALYDSGFDFGDANAKAMGINCYDEEPVKDLASVGPRLVRLWSPDPDVESTKSQIASWLTRCSGRPMLSFLASQASPYDIAEHWARLHMALTKDREQFLLRIADTRTLPVLAKTFTPEQWRAWTQPLTRWLFIDRTGSLAALPMPEEEVRPHAAPLVLADEQFDVFVESSEPDALIAFFDEQLSDLVPLPDEMRPSQWHGIVAASLELGREHGIDRLEDKVALVQVATMTDGAALVDERVLKMLDASVWQPGNMSEALLETGVLD